MVLNVADVVFAEEAPTLLLLPPDAEEAFLCVSLEELHDGSVSLPLLHIGLHRLPADYESLMVKQPW